MTMITIYNGFSPPMIPMEDLQDSETLYHQFLSEGDPEIGDNLLQSLDVARRRGWIEITESMNLQHSS